MNTFHLQNLNLNINIQNYEWCKSKVLQCRKTTDFATSLIEHLIKHLSSNGCTLRMNSAVEISIVTVLLQFLTVLVPLKIVILCASADIP